MSRFSYLCHQKVLPTAYLIFPFCKLHPLLLVISSANVKHTLFLYLCNNLSFFSNCHAVGASTEYSKGTVSFTFPNTYTVIPGQTMFGLYLKTITPKTRCFTIAVMSLGLHHLTRTLLCQWTLSTQP